MASKAVSYWKRTSGVPKSPSSLVTTHDRRNLRRGLFVKFRVSRSKFVTSADKANSSMWGVQDCAAKSDHHHSPSYEYISGRCEAWENGSSTCPQREARKQSKRKGKKERGQEMRICSRDLPVGKLLCCPEGITLGAVPQGGWRNSTSGYTLVW